MKVLNMLSILALFLTTTGFTATQPPNSGNDKSSNVIQGEKYKVLAINTHDKEILFINKDSRTFMTCSYYFDPRHRKCGGTWDYSCEDWDKRIGPCKDAFEDVFGEIQDI